jgi:hypothetical protein
LIAKAAKKRVQRRLAHPDAQAESYRGGADDWKIVTPSHLLEEKKAENTDEEREKYGERASPKLHLSGGKRYLLLAITTVVE